MVLGNKGFSLSCERFAQRLVLTGQKCCRKKSMNREMGALDDT